MNRRIAIIIVILGALVTTSSAFAASTSNTTQPSVLVDETPPPPVEWHCYSASPGPCPDDGDSPWGYSIEGTTSKFMDMLKGQIVCEGWGCSQVEVYIQVDYHVEWRDDFERDVTVGVTWWGDNPGAPYEQIITCGDHGTSGECGGHVYVMLDAAEISPDPSSSYHAGARLTVGGTGSGGTVDVDFTVTFSGDPIDIDKCDSQYLVVDCDTTALDPTSETGVAADLTIGNMYRIKTEGSWNDGTADRSDIAVSTDGGVTWDPLSVFMVQPNVECIQNDADDTETPYIYFTAESEDFAVRVNDTEGDFADNTGTISFTMCGAVLTGSGCEDQFQQGTLVTSLVVPADDPGYEAGPILTVGEWYVMEVSGTWRNGGVSTPRRDMEVYGPSGWVELSDWSQSDCGTDDGLISRFYFQAFTTDLTLRVHDPDSPQDWSNNFGAMQVDIYGATYSRFISSCESTFDLGNLFKDGFVSGSAGAGIQILDRSEYGDIPVGGSSSPSDRWFAIEVIGGPWSDGAASSYAAQVSNVDIDFTDFSAWPYCAVQTDLIGHWRVYVPGYGTEFNDDMWYRYRVDDNALTFGDNSGILGYQIYNIYNLGHNDPVNPPAPSVCTDAGYGMSDDYADIVVSAQSAGGVYLPNVEAGYMYAVQTTDGPWNNNGTTSYEMEISDDGGTTWSPIWQHAAILCSQQGDDENHVTVWINVAAGHNWKVRVLDAGQVFSDNSGSMGVRVYEAFYGEDPWSSCGDNYSLTEYPLTPPANTIYAYQPTGTEVPFLGNLIVGSTVAVEITDDSHWQPDGGNDSWQAQITFDGGTTWYAFEDSPLKLCVITVDPSNGRKRIYFSNPGRAGDVRVRVDYDGTDWGTNDGSLVFKLYRAPAADPDDPFYDPELPVPPEPPPFIDACSAGCMRPQGLLTYYPVNLPFVAALSNPVLDVAAAVLQFLGVDTSDMPQVSSMILFPVPDVGGWVEYARCSIMQYIAWCPVHYKIISGYATMMRNVEPVATMWDIVDLMDYTFLTFRSYDWTSTGGGGDEGDPIRAESIVGDILLSTQAEGGGDAESMQSASNTVTQMFLPQPDSIWSGGSFDFTLVPDPATITQCSFRNIFSVSDNLGSTVCLIQNIMLSKMGTVILFMFDIMFIFQFLVKWLPKIPIKFRRALAPFENATVSYKQ